MPYCSIYLDGRVEHLQRVFLLRGETKVIVKIHHQQCRLPVNLVLQLLEKKICKTYGTYIRRYIKIGAKEQLLRFELYMA